MRARATAMATAIVAMLAGGAIGAEPAAYRAPHTSWGAPDLEGVWSTLSLTSLQRPPNAKALVVPAGEVAEYERQRNDPAFLTKLFESNPRSRPEGEIGGPYTEWLDQAHLNVVDGQARSSVLVEPLDGRLPMRPETRARLAALDKQTEDLSGPEARAAPERCVGGPGAIAGPPLNSFFYNSNVAIVQTPHAIAIIAEMIHELRRVDLDAPAADFAGEPRSVGRWEGDTLVVETSRFPADFRGSQPLSPTARVEERFTRTGPATLRYSFTVDDEANYTARWRGERTLSASAGPMLEYACHEGNYSLPNILRAARLREAAAAGAP